MRRVGRGAIAAAVLLAPAIAHAGDGLAPRTPVLWNDPPCMTVVDRSASPILHIDYAIPREDTMKTSDEVEDSRRHQFIGFCRQESPQQPIPTWLSEADVQASGAMGELDPADIAPEEILEQSAWAGCFVRIDADAERRPITFAAAAEGVDWDTASLATGVYTVAGYTWQPPFNLWSPRPGVVKIVDAIGADDDPPALAVANGETIIHRDEVASIAGCVDALPGSTVTAAWAAVGPPDSQKWAEFATDVPVDGDSFTLDFTPPAEVIGDAANIRVVISAPNGKQYVAYMREQVTVLGSDAGSCDEGGFIGGPGCAGTGTSTGVDEVSSSESTTSAEQGGGSGCGCSNDPRTNGAGPWLVLLWLSRRAAGARSSRAAPRYRTACRAVRARVPTGTPRPRP